MPRIRFIQRDGSESSVEVGSDVSVMLAALRNGISGIEGECGGCIDCATCHVYVHEEQARVLPPPSEDESGLLSALSRARKPNSRLGCQLTVPASITELVIFIPGQDR